jgi:hypothetical protein
MFARRRMTSALFVALAAAFSISACKQSAPEKAEAAAAAATSEPAVPALPPPVNGWIEHPLPQGVVKVQPAQWRSDTIHIPVKPSGELEYKLSVQQGDSFVYTIDYGKLDHAGVVVSEFHGHTPKRADGVGDLMFYSKTGGALQHGQFTAPWDGIHGWYLKNDSTKDVTVTLKLAGFYELVEQ